MALRHVRIAFAHNCRQLLIHYKLALALAALCTPLILLGPWPGLHNRSPWEVARLGDSHPTRHLSIVCFADKWTTATGMGLYLWQHVLGAALQADAQQQLSGQWSDKDLSISFQWSLNPSMADIDPNQHLLLVLQASDGRGSPVEQTRIAKSIIEQSLTRLNERSRLFILIDGSVVCHDDWLPPVVRTDRVGAVFIPHDSNLVDHVKFFPWPLGVATYRGFSPIDRQRIDPTRQRRNFCNFFGSLHNTSANSSRRILSDAIGAHKCKRKWRTEWPRGEQIASMKRYVNVLLDSDLTLSPVGLNAECHRTYEALATGSLPIVEDGAGLRAGSRCRRPYGVLRSFQAPMVYVKDWRQFVADNLSSRWPYKEVIAMRRRVTDFYYDEFLPGVRRRFLSVVRSRIA